MNIPATQIAHRRRLTVTGRKNGVIYLHCPGGRKDHLEAIIEIINRKTILISEGRPVSLLYKLNGPYIKSVIYVDPSKVIGLERWDERTDIFFYAVSNLKRALKLAESLSESGDVVFYTPYFFDPSAGERDNIYERLVENRILS